MKNTQQKKVIGWVEYLGVKEALYLSLKVNRHRYNIQEIRFLKKSSWVGEHIARIFILQGTSQKIIKKPFKLTMPINAAGERLFWNVWEDFSRFSLEEGERSGADKQLAEELDHSYDRATVARYLIRQFGYDQYENLKVLRIVRQYVEAENNEDEHLVLLQGKIWEDALKAYAPYPRLAVLCFAYRNYLFWSLIRIANIIIKIIKNCLLYILSKFSEWIKRLSHSADSKARVGVFFAQGEDLQRRSDLFWLPYSGIHPEDIVVYFLDPSKPVTQEKINSLKNLGVKWFSFMSQRFHKTPEAANLNSRYYLTLVKLHIKSLKILKKLGRALGDHFGLRGWQYEQLIWLLDRTAHYEAFFSTYNIKVHFGFYSEIDQNLMAVHLAAQRTQTVNICSHWSNHPGAQVWPSHDVYFTWGPRYLPYYEKWGHGYKNILFCGYLFDNLFKGLSLKARNHRQILRQRGVEFVVCLMDNAYDEGGWFAKEDLQRFHEVFFKETRLNPKMGVILKPKRLESLKAIMFGNTLNMIEELKNEGRCLILDQGQLPSEAAQASDLVVGFGVFNSAAIESALAGVPVILFDPVMQKIDSLYQTNAAAGLIFNDFNLMMEAVRKYERKEQSLPGFADFSSILPSIDPFRDGKAYMRVGSYIKRLLDEFSKGSTHERALAATNEFYHEQYEKGFTKDSLKQSLLSH